MKNSEQQSNSQGVEQTDLATLVKHREWVQADTPLSDVYRWFEQHDQDTCGVIDGNQLLGLCLRGRLGFLMGHRYGYAIYSRQPVRMHLNENSTFIRQGAPLREVLERVLSRPGKSFNEDVALLGPGNEFVGIIAVPDLVKLQSALVAEKFRTQEELHSQLLSVSRQAGMAEVATSVLHNVGNVLNSVKVAASVLGETLQASKTTAVTRVGKLMRDNAGNLADYVTNDERGRKIPTFLEQLGQHLELERAELQKELEALTKYIDHIERVICTQQRYAKVTAVAENVCLADLIEDAIKINSESYSRHGITIRREFEAVPETIVDKHKVLQILVNLLSNAKHACQITNRPGREVTLSLKSSGQDRVKIRVTDNGIGIPPENLTRIFNHGFTTRETGHGFGLHNGALAAKEMGGSLSVHSDGTGCGAAFTLDIPMVAVRHNAKHNDPLTSETSHTDPGAPQPASTHTLASVEPVAA